MAVRELPVARSRPTWTLMLTSLAFFMVALDTLVVVTALPAIQRDLHANLSLLEWTINAFTLAFAAGVITAAALVVCQDLRLVFAISPLVFTLASQSCALPPTTE